MNIYYKLILIGALILFSAAFLFIYIRKYNKHLNLSINGQNGRRMADPAKVLRSLMTFVIIGVIVTSLIPKNIVGNAPKDHSNEDIPNDKPGDDYEADPSIQYRIYIRNDDLDQSVTNNAKVQIEGNFTSARVFNGNLGAIPADINQKYDIVVINKQIKVNVLPESQSEMDQLVELIQVIDQSME